MQFKIKLANSTHLCLSTGLIYCTDQILYLCNSNCFCNMPLNVDSATCKCKLWDAVISWCYECKIGWCSQLEVIFFVFLFWSVSKCYWFPSNWWNHHLIFSYWGWLLSSSLNSYWTVIISYVCGVNMTTQSHT